jgi:hypothetical protein
MCIYVENRDAVALSYRETEAFACWKIDRILPTKVQTNFEIQRRAGMVDAGVSGTAGGPLSRRSCAVMALCVFIRLFHVLPGALCESRPAFLFARQRLMHSRFLNGG